MSSVLLQVGADKINQILAKIGRQRSMTILKKMQADVVFQHLCHQPVDAASHRGQQHQHLSAIVVFCTKLSFKRFHLSTNPFCSVQQFHSFAV